MDVVIESILNFLRSFSSIVRRRYHQFKFGTKAQLAFLEDFAVLINDGIPANRAIELMSQISTGITREVADSISYKIAQGQLLADGMEDWFSPNVIEMVRVGESGGALGETLKSAIDMLSRRGVALGSFISAVAYPLMVIIMGCFVILYLNQSVFVQFLNIKPLDQWPESGQRLVSLAYFIQHWSWVLIVGIVVLVIALRWLMINYTGELRPWLDSIPPFNFYKRFLAARLLETLGLLVSSGVVFKSAIRVMQSQASPYFASHLILMEHLLGRGRTNIAEVLDTGLVDDRELMRLRVMAEVKGFEHGLIRMGVRGSEQVTTTLKVISRAIGGTLLTFGAILIILIVQGVYMTGMSMSA